MQNKLLLSELNYLIRDTLEEAFPETVWVIAEISEMKENRSGHCYLELIEKGDGEEEIIARARATIWSYTYRMLKPYFEASTGQPLISGIKILVQVSVEFHPAFGLSLNIKDIDPTYTIGDLARRRKDIIDRLKNEGVFDMNKEVPLPEVPQKIAVISSATAAGYQDFITQLENNPYGFVFYHKLFESFMQGTETVSSVIYALERIYQHEEFFDIVVIIRGGGAQADLSSFDNYDLALNVAQFPLPVLTGIGHEKDDTVVDMVAHTRLKTPTAVAEFLISGALRFYENLNSLENEVIDRTTEILEQENQFLYRTSSGFAHSAQQYIKGKEFRLTELSRVLESVTNNFVFKKIQRLISFTNRSSSNSVLFLNGEKNKISQYLHDLKYLSEFVILSGLKSNSRRIAEIKNSILNFLQTKSSAIQFQENSVRLLNPENVLNRGFTLTYKDRNIIKLSAGLQEGETLTTRFSDGKVKSRIIKNLNNDNKKG